jgi:hypothetical protein
MFENPKLKIEWANHHIRQLNDALVAFCETDFYTLGIEDNAGQQTLKFGLIKPIPSDVPRMIDDVAHSLRSALDLLVHDVFCLGGKTAPESCYFPVRRTKDKVIAALKKGRLKAANPTIAGLIVNTIQPYVGGNGAPIYGLHTLDIQNKHLLIVPAIAVTALPIDAVVYENGPMFVNLTFQVTGNRIVGLMSHPTPIKFISYGKPTFDVRFDKLQPFEDQPVVPTLRELSQLVSQVVGIIEQHC